MSRKPLKTFGRVWGGAAKYTRSSMASPTPRDEEIGALHKDIARLTRERDEALAAVANLRKMMAALKRLPKATEVKGARAA